jgi:hypothetical protein
MDEQEFKQLRATDQVSCNGVTGVVLGVDHDGVRIHFDGDRGGAVLSTKDLGQLSSLRLVRKAPEMLVSYPTSSGLYPRGLYTRADQSR